MGVGVAVVRGEGVFVSYLYFQNKNIPCTDPEGGQGVENLAGKSGSYRVP